MKLKYMPSPPEEMINARLIEHAPMMLRVLKSVAVKMQDERPNACRSYTDGKTGLFAMENLILMIIAKAEGK